MADQQSDYNIKVVTTADLSGLRDASAEMARIRQQGLLAPIPAGLSGAKIAEEVGNIYPLLPQSAAATKEIADEAGRSAINIGKARQEAVILARELASGVPSTRTLSSLLGSLGIPITVAAIAGIALYKAFESSAEAVKKTREEQEKLNEQLDKNLKGYEKISDTEQWDKANEAIEDQIKLLERRLYLATDTKERASIFQQLQYAEQEKRLLPEIVAKGFERAAAERAVKEEIKAQVDAINEVARGYDRERQLVEQNATAAKELRNIQKQAQEDVISDKLSKGQITALDAITQREKLRADQAAKDHAASKQQVDERLKANADEFADLDAKSNAAHKDLEERREELEKIQYLKTLGSDALEPDEKEQVENIKQYEAALKEAEATTEKIDALRAASARKSDDEIGKLIREKEILDQIYDAEEKRNKAIFERNQKAQVEKDVGGASPQVKAFLANEAAAQTAREAGDARSADMYEKSAAALERGMTGPQQAELARLREEAKSPPVGRTAQTGESQDLVDQLERNRINNERVQRGEPPLADNGKDSGLIEAFQQALNQTMARYWGP